MINLVADTSVIIKWFSPEEDWEKAAKIAEMVADKKAKIVLPQSVPLELINALHFGNKFPLEKTIECLIAFFDLQPELVSIDKLSAQKVTRFSYDVNLTSYDAAFLIIAEERGIKLFTADYKHHQKSISKNIVWLSEWKGKL